MPLIPHDDTNGEVSRRKEKVAINLFDLDRVPSEIRSMLFAGRLDLAHPVKTDWDRVGSVDEIALVFKCDLLTAATVCDIVRGHDREAGDFPTRLYICRNKWSRIPSYVNLSIVEDGKCKLNPEVFKVEVVLAPPVPLSRKPVRFGK